MTKLRGHCPHCFEKVSVAINHFGDDRPMSGDIGICKGCGGMILFDFSRRRNVCIKPDREQAVKILANRNYCMLHAMMTMERVA